jgi:tellurite resistance protein TehA-like permease
VAARLPRPSAGSNRFRALRLFGAWTEREVAHLDPGCFAIVMATGIISNAFFLEGRHELSNGLLAVNLAVYAWLWVATAVRATRFPAALRADLANPRLVFSSPRPTSLPLRSICAGSPRLQRSCGWSRWPSG